MALVQQPLDGRSDSTCCVGPCTKNLALVQQPLDGRSESWCLGILGKDLHRCRLQQDGQSLIDLNDNRSESLWHCTLGSGFIAGEHGMSLSSPKEGGLGLQKRAPATDAFDTIEILVNCGAEDHF